MAKFKTLAPYAAYAGTAYFGGPMLAGMGPLGSALALGADVGIGVKAAKDFGLIGGKSDDSSPQSATPAAAPAGPKPTPGGTTIEGAAAATLDMERRKRRAATGGGGTILDGEDMAAFG